MNKERLQKKIEPDPRGKSHECLGLLKKSVYRCAASDAIVYTGCVFENAEVAFYEKQVSENEMNSLKNIAADLRGEFIYRCRCEQRK